MAEEQTDKPRTESQKREWAKSTAAITKFIEEFKNESERAMVVLTAARIDFSLQLILQKHLVPNVSTTDILFESQGPASTFSNKTLLAYRLGLIDREFTQAINSVRKIRNSFAHEYSNCSLDSGSHFDQVKALCAPFKRYFIFDYIRTKFFGDDKSSKTDYMTATAIIMFRLEALYNQVACVEPEKASPLFNAKMKAPQKSD